MQEMKDQSYQQIVDRYDTDCETKILALRTPHSRLAHIWDWLVTVLLWQSLNDNDNALNYIRLHHSDQQFVDTNGLSFLASCLCRTCLLWHLLKYIEKEKLPLLFPIYLLAMFNFSKAQHNHLLQIEVKHLVVHPNQQADMNCEIKILVLNTSRSQLVHMQILSATVLL